jgi:hypothetical protein
LHVIVRKGRINSDTPAPEIEHEIWKHCTRTHFVRELATNALRRDGYDVAPIGTKMMWRDFPQEAQAFLTMSKGGGRAGSSVYTLAVRRKA